MRTSNWRGFQDANYRPEHPQLAKIMFGLSMVDLPERPLIADLMSIPVVVIFLILQRTLFERMLFGSMND